VVKEGDKDIDTEDSQVTESIGIQDVLKEVPDEILIGVLAGRLQHEPNGNIGNVVSQQVFSGPIPPPAMLGEYDEIQAGFADRIL